MYSKVHQARCIKLTSVHVTVYHGRSRLAAVIMLHNTPRFTQTVSTE